MHTRIHLLRMALVAFLSYGVSFAQIVQAQFVQLPHKPNIVIIVSDDHR